MNDQTLVQLLKNDAKNTITKVTWEELLKIAQINETVKQHGRQFVIASKEYVEDMEGLFEIKLFGAEK